jgi:hypothetical protein
MSHRLNEDNSDSGEESKVIHKKKMTVPKKIILKKKIVKNYNKENLSDSNSDSETEQEKNKVLYKKKMMTQKKIIPKKKIIKKEESLEEESSEEESSEEESSEEESSNEKSSDEEKNKILCKKKMTKTKKIISKKKIIKKKESSDEDNSDEEVLSDHEIEQKETKNKVEDEKKNINYYKELNVLDYGKTKYIECYEDIDVDKLSYIVRHKKKFKNEIKTDNDNWDSIEMAKKLLKKSRGGKVKVLYKQTENVGRFNAARSLSQQTTQRRIRHTIALDYVDIDISNSGPAILKFICDQNKIECSILQKYCANREKFLTDNDLTFEIGKVAFISIINGGHELLPEGSKELREFMYDEIKKIHNNIILLHPQKFEEFKKKRLEDDEPKHKYNHEGAFVSNIIYDIENKILMTMYEFFGKPKNVVLCFDGLMLKNNINYDLKKCQKYVFDKLHINITLAKKPFNEKLSVPKKILKYKETTFEYFSDFGKLVDNDVELEVAEEWLNNSIKFIDKETDLLIFAKCKKIDSDIKETFSYYIQSDYDKIAKTLKNINCNIINPKFDYELFQECSKNNKKLKTLSMEDQQKTYRYLYTCLSNSKGKGFFDVYSVHRKYKHKSKKSDTDDETSDETDDENDSENKNIYPSQRYSDVEFYPFLKRKGIHNTPDTFNIFTEYPLDKVKLMEKIDFTKSKWYTHMKTDLTNNNNAEFENLLDWIAIKLQYPTVLIPAQLFYGEQGTGKGTFVEFIKRLLGSNNVVTIENIDTYLDKFNADMAFKSIKVLEEIEDNGKAYTNHNRIKADMKKTTERMEDKYKKAVTLKHFSSYIFNTNNKKSLKIEASDRRFTCHMVSDAHADNTEYFNSIYEELQNVQFMKNAFEFFAEREYNKNMVRKAFTNYFKIQQKLSDMPIGLKFTKNLIEEGINKKYCLKDDLVKAVHVHQQYKDWCGKNGCTQYYNETTFKDQLKLIKIEQKRYERNGTKLYCYNFNKETVEIAFKIYLKATDFVFNIDEYYKIQEDETTD